MVGPIGVLGTLVYLAIQTLHTNEAALNNLALKV